MIGTVPVLGLPDPDPIYGSPDPDLYCKKYIYGYGTL
jgi:hypothetical protein